MRRLVTSIIAGGLSVLLGAASFTEASAMTMPDLRISQPEQKAPQLEQVRWHGGHTWHHHGGWHGGYHGGYHHRYYGRGWHHGGYYRDDNAWVPLAAFAAGAVIAGAASHPAYRTYRSHSSWCAARYKTYRASDNTYQPNSGPRQQCR